MATPKEIDKDLVDRLYDLLMIKKANKGVLNPRLEDSIGRAKAPMAKEVIAWVEQLVNEQG